MTIKTVYCICCPYTWTAFEPADAPNVILTGLCPNCFYSRFGTFVKFREK